MSSVTPVPKSVHDLAEAIRSQLSPEQQALLAPFVNKVIEDSSRRSQLLKTIQEALGTLRTDIQYLMFDLEATRRERDAALRKL